MHRRIFVLLVVLALGAVPLLADHSWGSYHWARTSNPFTLKVHDNLTSKWEPYLSEADTDWDKSSVLDLSILWQSPLSSVKRCTSTSGRIEVCNAKYGNNGWLGVAGIWASGNHITKAYTKVNDTYFDTATYDKPAWRRLVMCQEIGHDFGLDHQDEAFDNTNLGTCMDYTNDPDGTIKGQLSNEHPNAHDYDQIETIYAHLDSTTTISAIFDTMTHSASRPQTIEEIMADASQWGAPVRFDKAGRPNLFAMPVGLNDAGETEIMFTHVFWAPINPFEGRFDGPGRDRSNEE
ncbi:MAG TPA: hypothetical protein VNA69_04915 [Thermoanaerobaculia bacterium]|nr:hypothetical protein [Thermoanaerobaculia bacterium]